MPMLPLRATSGGRRPAGPPASQARGSSGGIGRGTSARAEAVSDDLRRGTGDFLGQRRGIGALALGAIGTLGVVAAYQMGLIKHVPDPPLPLMNADDVDASGEAYSMFSTPDSGLGMVSFAVTLVLAGMGTRDRHRQQPWIPLALAGKVTLDAVSGGYLTLEQATKHRAFCGWCLLSSAAGIAMVPLALPEARQALRELRGRG